MWSRHWSRCKCSISPFTPIQATCDHIHLLFSQLLLHIVNIIQTLCRLPLQHKRHHLYQRPRDRNRHRQHPSEPSSAHCLSGLILGCSHPDAQQHLLQRHISRLAHCFDGLRSQLRSRARHEFERYSACFVESTSEDRTCEGDHGEVLGPAWLAY